MKYLIYLLIAIISQPILASDYLTENEAMDAIHEDLIEMFSHELVPDNLKDRLLDGFENQIPAPRPEPSLRKKITSYVLRKLSLGGEDGLTYFSNKTCSKKEMEAYYDEDEIAKSLAGGEGPYFLSQPVEGAGKATFVHYPSENLTLFATLNEKKEKEVIITHIDPSGIYMYLPQRKDIAYFPVVTDNLIKLRRFPLFSYMLSIAVVAKYGASLWAGPTLAFNKSLMIVPPLSFAMKDKVRGRMLVCGKGEKECYLKSRVNRKSVKVGPLDPAFVSYRQKLKDEGLLSDKHRKILKQKCDQLRSKNFRRLVRKSISDLSGKCNMAVDDGLLPLGDVEEVCSMADKLFVTTD